MGRAAVVVWLLLVCCASGSRAVPPLRVEGRDPESQAFGRSVEVSVAPAAQPRPAPVRTRLVRVSSTETLVLPASGIHQIELVPRDRPAGGQLGDHWTPQELRHLFPERR